MHTTTQRHMGNGRVSPAGDAQCLRPDAVRNGQELPTQGRSQLKKLAKRIRLATINIGTMTGRSRELANSLKERKVDIACVQDTKWAGAKSREIGEGYKLIYHGKKTAQNGVGVVVSQWIRDSVTKDCLMSTKISMGTSTLRVVSCYAPQAGCPDKEKEKFWHDLETHIQAIDDSEILFIGGVLKGHVGRAKDNFNRNHGGQGHGNRNEGGTQILEHAEAWDLAITNTFFKKQESHLITYYSGGRTSQIDYWVVRQRDLKMVTDTKISPQHRLDMLVKTCTATTLGTTKPNLRFIDKQTWWWNDDVQHATKAKKDAYKTWWQTKCPDDLKSTAKRTVATAKVAHYQDLNDQLDTPVGQTIYKLARARDCATQDLGHVINIKDENGQMLQKPKDTLRRWKNYSEKICNEEFPHPPLPTADTTSSPVPASIHRRSNHPHQQDEKWQSNWAGRHGAQGAECLTDLFNKIIKKKAPLETWETSTTVPIWKGKGDVNDCSNYSPIRLLCHTMKIFECVLDAQLRTIVDISPNQCGFVRNCGTTDAIHAARLLMERHHEKRKTIHMAFLNLEKAFDRVPHDLIWLALRQHHVAYVSWTKLLYQKATSSVRCAAGTSDTFPINVGIHQSSALSPLLFILCMDTVTK
uniref:Reverse transcriptase domain-containing protein n=1 Tax=Lepisosteus oculatus TaxID=7918 RepID=W5LYV5_LEPOC